MRLCSVGCFFNVFLGFVPRFVSEFCSVLLSLSYSAQIRGSVSVSVLEKFDNFFKACLVHLVDHASDWLSVAMAPTVSRLSANSRADNQPVGRRLGYSSSSDCGYGCSACIAGSRQL